MESLDNQRFDLVCCSEVVEHVSNQKEFVQNCTQLVKPGGLFFLSTIAKTPEAYFSNIILGEYIFKLLPKGTHEYNLFVSHDTVEGFIESSFQTIEAKGVTVKNPVTFEMGENDFLRSNYMMIFKKRLDL